MKPVRDRSVPAPAHLEGLDRYEPGMSIEQVQREQGLADVVKLASNENPLGPSPLALEAARQALGSIHRYPDGAGTVLRAKLAARLGVLEEQVTLGNGSSDLIDLLARAYLSPGDNAVIAERGFARFRQSVNSRNRGARLVPMRAHTHDLEAMREACDARTRLLFVANPNNPTGTWNARREFDALLSRLPKGVLVVLDEAYFQFAQDEPDYPNGLDFVASGAPVAVLRTFSKAYGLAGLRIGYAVAAPETIAALDTVREPFNTGSLGQLAAHAALDDHQHVSKSLALNRTQKARLEAELRGRGLGVLPSLGNFLCVEMYRDGGLVFRRLIEHGVIVRPLQAYDLPSHLRISVGAPAEIDRLLAALDSVLLEIPRA